MSQPFTIVELVDDDGDEFPVRLPGVYRENRAADMEAALQIANEHTATGAFTPNGELRVAEITYHGESKVAS